MKTHLLMGGSNVKAEVLGGDLVIEGTDHMIAVFTKLRDKRLRKVKLYLSAGLELKIEHSNGWEMILKEEGGDDHHLIITRYRSGNDRVKQRQYLSTNMKWLSYPQGGCVLPEDALRLPIFAP